MQLNSFSDITSDYQYIYLSPHFDDVVYSCAGTIGAQVHRGHRPLVITVFAGIPPSRLKLSVFAVKFHTYMGFDQFASKILKYRGVGRVVIPLREMLASGQDAGAVIRARRKEDARALTYLQADYLWLDYLEAIYRGSPAYYHRQSQLVGGEVNPADRWIEKQLALDLLTLHKRLPSAVWYAPLGIGRHLDHQIVTSAVDALIQVGANVKLYEDFPYVVREGALEHRLEESAWRLVPELVEVCETLHLRQTAAEMYSSQTKMNFENVAKMYSSQIKESLDSKEAMYKIMSDYTQCIHPEKTEHMERYWIPGKALRDKVNPSE